MLLNPFTSLLDKAETIVTIYKHNYGHHNTGHHNTGHHNTGHHNQHCRPNHNNDEIVMNI